MHLNELIHQIDGIRLLVGKNQTTRRLRSVYTTDLADPSRYLSGGELVLTSGLWVDSADSCSEFAEALVHSNAAALGFGIGQIAAVPGELIVACTRLRLPLLEVAGGVSFEAVTETILEERSAAQKRYLSGSLAMSRRLHTATAEGGLGALMATVSAQIDRPCWLLSPTGQIVGGPDPIPDGLARQVIAEHASHPLRARFAITTSHDGEMSVHTVPGEERHWSRLLVCATAFGQMRLDQRDLVEDALRVLAVLDVSGASGDQARAVSAQLLMDSLDQGNGTTAQVVALLKVLGLSQCPALSVVLIGSSQSGLADVILRDFPSLDHELSTVAHAAGASARLITTGPEHEVLRVKLQRYLRDIEPLITQHHVYMGIGDPGSSPPELRRSLLQAKAALSTAQTQQGEVVPVFASGLRSAHFLLANLTTDLRMTYRRQVLGPVIDYDTKHRAELEDTLRSFLHHSGSYRASATALQLHVNTVRYRMQNVERLTGLKVTNLPDQVTLYLAIDADRQ